MSKTDCSICSANYPDLAIKHAVIGDGGGAEAHFALCPDCADSWTVAELWMRMTTDKNQVPEADK